MSVRYESTHEIKTKLCADDIEYLRRQVLTSRSVLSENERITEETSMLYEAAKTMLTAIEMLLPMFNYESVGVSIKKISIRIADSTDDPNNTDVSEADIEFEAKLFSTAPNIMQLQHNSSKLWGTMRFARNDDESQRFEFVQTYRITCGYFGPGKEVLCYRTETPLSSNGVLAYSENFPMPSQYRELIRESVFDRLPEVFSEELRKDRET